MQRFGARSVMLYTGNYTMSETLSIRIDAETTVGEEAPK